MLFSSHEVQPDKARPTAKRNKTDFISPIMWAYFEFTSFGNHCFQVILRFLHQAEHRTDALDVSQSQG